METIGQRIKKLREAMNVSQEYLGNKVGVSRVAVTKWESGQTSNLKLDNLMKLCSIFNISVEELIYGDKFKREVKHAEDNKVKLTSKRELEMKELNEIMKSMDEDEFTKTKSVAEALAQYSISKKKKKTEGE